MRQRKNDIIVILFSFILLTLAVRAAETKAISAKDFAGADETVVNSGRGWKVSLVYGGIPIFRASPNAYDLDRFVASGGGENLPVVTSICPHPPTLELNAPTRFMMLKLATTGSTWIGSLLKNLTRVRFEAELITGSGGEQMQDKRKEKTMVRSVEDCDGASFALCGFSINSKNAANLNFAAVALRSNMRMVVWVRSNVVSHAIGLFRASDLHKGLLGSSVWADSNEGRGAVCKP